VTTFEDVRPIADTVLYEGYVLYPYRADNTKNLVRWQFGVLAPPALVQVDPSERARLRAELLIDGRPGFMSLRLRFLQVQRRTVFRDSAFGEEEVSRLDAGETAYLPFDEAVSHEVDLEVDVASASLQPVLETREIVGGVDHQGVPGGRLRRERLPLTAAVTTTAQALPGPYGVTRLRVDVANVTRWSPETSPRRDEALRHSLVAAHLVAVLHGGRFLSLTEPPEWATGYVAGCENDGVWPVLADADGQADAVLCSPIILPDRPQVAPESTTQFFDGTEMDEMLNLRAMTLTDAEKRAVRGTDPRAAELLDRADHLPPELMDRLHGAIRYLSSSARVEPPDQPPSSVDVRGVPVSEGSRVLLRPGSRRTDAQDLFVAGRTATVAKVVHDVDGRDHLAVLLDDDPGQDLAAVQGRFLYFAPDEVEPIGAGR
jgi:hypothetical protein